LEFTAWIWSTMRQNYEREWISQTQNTHAQHKRNHSTRLYSNLKIKVEQVNACLELVETAQEVYPGKGNSEEESRAEVREKDSQKRNVSYYRERNRNVSYNRER
jgi:hypothetical protein